MDNLTFFENLGATLESDKVEKSLEPYIGSNRYTDSNGDDYLMIPLKNIINVEFNHRLSINTHSTITLTYIVRYGND